LSAAGPHAALSVVVATRNRGATVVRTVASILVNREPLLEILVVDQSDDASTRDALEPLLGDERLRYVRSTTVGLARARNEGVAAASAPLVALTDDDCEVPADWGARIVEALEGDERLALVFGNVVPAPFDSEAGYIPGYVRRAEFLADELGKKSDVDGTGACMAVRRRAWAAIGGFDEMLGAGSVFPAADEGDFAIRALAAGWCVLETPAVWVVHHGFRTRREGHELVCVYARGTGAMMGKHLRCRTPRTGRLLAAMAWRWTLGSVHPSAQVGDGRHRLLRLLAFVQGLAMGAAAPVDRGARLFAPPATRPGEAGAGR
jgi:GT2 family glycosyltransferase